MHGGGGGGGGKHNDGGGAMMHLVSCASLHSADTPSFARWFTTVFLSRQHPSTASRLLPPKAAPVEQPLLAHTAHRPSQHRWTESSGWKPRLPPTQSCWETLCLDRAATSIGHENDIIYRPSRWIYAAKLSRGETAKQRTAPRRAAAGPTPRTQTITPTTRKRAACASASCAYSHSA
jgi:hypothetical protein